MRGGGDGEREKGTARHNGTGLDGWSKPLRQMSTKSRDKSADYEVSAELCMWMNSKRGLEGQFLLAFA